MLPLYSDVVNIKYKKYFVN